MADVLAGHVVHAEAVPPAEYVWPEHAVQVPSDAKINPGLQVAALHADLAELPAGLVTLAELVTSAVVHAVQLSWLPFA